MLPSKKIVCNKCNLEKKVKHFYKTYSGYLQKKCIECVAVTNREKQLELKRKKKYKLW